MLNSLQTSFNDDKTTHIRYTFTFPKTQHIIYGEFDANQADTTKALQAATATDSWAGFKTLILNTLVAESNEVLGAK